MSKPIIGITMNTIPANHWTIEMGIAAPNQDFQGLAVDYMTMIEKAGGVPVILPSTEDLETAELLWDRLDGILISGGNDVNPMIFGERIVKCGNLDSLRDNYEIAAMNFALKKGIPVLGICRGIQVINAGLGGKNCQDLPSEGYKPHTILVRKRNEPTHSVEIKDGTPLAEIFGKKTVMVNSFHHQSAQELSPKLRLQAVSEDGVVESCYMPGKKFFMAVQWHPEMMYDSEEQLLIAKAFVSACE